MFFGFQAKKVIGSLFDLDCGSHTLPSRLEDADLPL
jgi:hypothetical protein